MPETQAPEETGGQFDELGKLDLARILLSTALKKPNSPIRPLVASTVFAASTLLLAYSIIMGVGPTSNGVRTNQSAVDKPQDILVINANEESVSPQAVTLKRSQ